MGLDVYKFVGHDWSIPPIETVPMSIFSANLRSFTCIRDTQKSAIEAVLIHEIPVGWAGWHQHVASFKQVASYYYSSNTRTKSERATATHCDALTQRSWTEELRPAADWEIELSYYEAETRVTKKVTVSTFKKWD